MKYTDKELLELAAKATGHTFDTWRPSDGSMFLMNDKGEVRVWNPLTDDVHAFRLVVKLSISFNDDYLYPDGERVIRVGYAFDDTLYGDSEACGDDSCSAARRAIVRAAAEIGRNMK